MLVQYDLFKSKEECEIEALEKECKSTRKMADNVRKGVFAKLNEIYGKLVDIDERLKIIEENICKGKLILKEKDE